MSGGPKDRGLVDMVVSVANAVRVSIAVSVALLPVVPLVDVGVVGPVGSAAGGPELVFAALLSGVPEIVAAVVGAEMLAEVTGSDDVVVGIPGDAGVFGGGSRSRRSTTTMATDDGHCKGKERENEKEFVHFIIRFGLPI